MSTDRDTHFQGFAELLCNEEALARILDNPYFASTGMRREIILLIAQRAYDLVFHALTGIGESNAFLFNRGERKVEEIVPDLDEWPEIPEYDW